MEHVVTGSLVLFILPLNFKQDNLNLMNSFKLGEELWRINGVRYRASGNRENILKLKTQFLSFLKYLTIRMNKQTIQLLLI